MEKERWTIKMIANDLTISEKTRLVTLIMREIAEIEKQNGLERVKEKDIKELEIIIEKLERM